MSQRNAKRFLIRCQRHFDGAITLPASVRSPSSVRTAPEYGDVVSVSESVLIFRGPGKLSHYFTLWEFVDGRWEIAEAVSEMPGFVHYTEVTPRKGWTLKIGSHHG